jgi:rubrerythrin
MVEKYLEKNADEKTAIVGETKDLLKNIDVAEAPNEAIGTFFEKLNTYEEKDKLQLLHDVLQEGEISIGTG